MSKHTPWQVVALLSGSENHRGYHIVNAEGWRLALVQPGDEDGKLGEQHARLIAAAPLLFAEVERQYAELASIHNDWPGRHSAEGQMKLNRLLDLIVMVTGRDHQDVQDDYTARGEQS